MNTSSIYHPKLVVRNKAVARHKPVSSAVNQLAGHEPEGMYLPGVLVPVPISNASLHAIFIWHTFGGQRPVCDAEGTQDMSTLF